MKLEIDILSNPHDFLEKWSFHYDYPNDIIYYKNIEKGLDDYHSFIELFRWKNGIYNVSKSKMKVIEGFWDRVEVLRELKRDFDWELFEKEFQPHKSSNIWKIFLLHIMDSYNFPIFDVHVFRFHHFFKYGFIKEIPNNQRLKYNYYKNEYIGWFRGLRDEYSLNPKKMDESFFKFGQILKPLKGLPVELIHR